MPIDRDPVVSIPSEHLRPGPGDNGYGVIVPGGGPDVLVTTCIAGVIPEDITHNVYHNIGGGPENLLKWLVVVRGAPTLQAGDAIQVLTGKYAGKYRAQVIEQVPDQQSFLLAQSIKES